MASHLHVNVCNLYLALMFVLLIIYAFTLRASNNKCY
jgi:hypothetical protein